MEELEVDFCDLCGTSVPKADLDERRAVRLKGRLVGGCCLAELRTGPTGPVAAVEGSGRGATAAPPRPGAATGGIVTAVFVVLVAIAATAVFLEWRLHDVAGELERTVESTRTALGDQDGRLVRIESRLTRTVVTDDLGGLEGRLLAMRDAFDQQESRLADSISTVAERQRVFDGRLENIAHMQDKNAAHFADILVELRNLGRDVAVLKAMPRAAPRDDRIVDPAPVPADVEVAVPGLPPELAHEIERLADADAGTRFEAVDELLQKNDSRAYEYILPLARDADPFVRRLVVEGLGEFRSGKAVDALLTALADPEGIVRHTAFTSLKKLTSQTIRFDPDAGPDQRSAMQRRWQQWWDKNREGFF